MNPPPRISRLGWPAFLTLALLYLSFTVDPARSAAPPATGPAEATTRPDEAARARRLVFQLSDPDPSVRRAADLQLHSLGGDAMPVIEELLKGELIPEERVRLERAARILRPRAKRQTAERARGEWERRTLHDAYDKSGNTGRAHDALAHAAIDAYLALGPDPPRAAAGPRDKALSAFRDALDAGCQDALIDTLYCLANAKLTGNLQGPVHDGMHGAARRCLKGNYAAPVKYRLWVGYLRLFEYAAASERETAISLLAQVAKSPGLPPGELDELAIQFAELQIESGDRWNRMEPFLLTYSQIAPNQPGPLLVEAWWNLKRAEQTRDGHGDWETKVVEVGKRASAAESLIDRAWELAPGDVRAANLMLSTKVLRQSVSGSDEALRKDVESWFTRATGSDPDDYRAYELKLHYLRRAEQSPDAMIAFGRECLATENWLGGVPFILVRAHEIASAQADDSAEYFQRPEVWNDFRAAYEGGLLNYPENLRWRCEYAKAAARAGQWDVARAQFRILGERADPAVFGSRTSMDYLRRKAERLGTAEQAK